MPENRTEMRQTTLPGMNGMRAALRDYLAPTIPAGEKRLAYVMRFGTDNPGAIDVVDARHGSAGEVIVAIADAKAQLLKEEVRIVLLVDAAPTKAEMDRRLESHFSPAQRNLLNLQQQQVTGNYVRPPEESPVTALSDQPRDVLGSEEPPSVRPDDKPR